MPSAIACLPSHPSPTAKEKEKTHPAFTKSRPIRSYLNKPKLTGHLFNPLQAGPKGGKRMGELRN